MPRNLLLPTLLLPALVGCSDVYGAVENDPSEGVYDDVQLSRDSSGDLTLTIEGNKRNGSCPPSLSGTARINDIAMKQTGRGGGEPVSDDSDEQDCRPLTFQLDAALLPADGEALDITFDPLLTAGREYEPARTWHVTLDSERVWTDDDLGARMHANEEFAVHWTPRDERRPSFRFSVFTHGTWERWQGLTVVRVRSEPGMARYRFDGPEPSHVWSLEATRERAPKAALCSGFERCSVQGWLDYDLTPVGISPASPDGVAPPRECIALPGEDGSIRYASPYWSEFPDLSLLQHDRHMSCASADLYFVVLGACGVCGGGKSTYVVGNRGTEPASFSVRSNLETLDGAVLAPQQLSEPFEISFDGALSKLEILNDDDCDPASNAAWVESVACDWPSWPPTPYWQPDGCNNICGL